MKCYTVTEKGVTPGIELGGSSPYPHVIVGDPDEQYDHRRVEVDDALAATASGGKILKCSMALDRKEGELRRVSYKLVLPDGSDDDKVLALFAVRVPDARTWYDVPRDTFMLAKGWISKIRRGPSVAAPVDLVVLKKDDAARVYKVESLAKSPVLILTVRFDGGGELKAA